MEKAALDASPYGCMGYEEDGTPSSWYGGKVQLRGTLVVQDGSGDIQLQLERLSLGPSTQLTRRFGSRHLFRVKLPQSSKVGNLNLRVLEYCKRPIVLCGFVYRAFHAKEDTVFYIKTNEVWDSGQRRLTGESLENGMSLIEFLRSFNPPELNGEQVSLYMRHGRGRRLTTSGQAMSKWVSRLALTLSNSVPGFLPLKRNIKFIDDIGMISLYIIAHGSLPITSTVHPVTGANMTDGAGTMNRALRRQLEVYRHSKQGVYAVQVRAHGAKVRLHICLFAMEPDGLS